MAESHKPAGALWSSLGGGETGMKDIYMDTAAGNIAMGEGSAKAPAAGAAVFFDTHLKRASRFKQKRPKQPAGQTGGKHISGSVSGASASGFYKIRFFRYFAALILSVAVLAGCSSQGPESRGDRDARRTDDEYDRRRDSDRDRDRVIDNSRRRHSGRDCEGDSECEDMCDEIYDRRGDKEDCRELAITQVEALLDVYESLKKPTDRNLRDIDLDDFDVLVNISIEPLDGLVGRYTSRQAKDVLVWLATDNEAAEVFKKEDEDLTLLEAIFAEIHSDEKEALKDSLEGGDTFLDLAVNSRNEPAAEWIHEFIEERVCTERNVESARCLKIYCEIAKAMRPDNAEDMIRFDFFEEYLEDIIEEGVNGDEWAVGHRTEGDRDTDPYHKSFQSSEDQATSEWSAANRRDAEANCGGTETNPDRCDPFTEIDDLDEDWWREVCS